MTSLRSVLVFLRNPTKDVYEKPGWNSEHLGIGYLAAALRQAGMPCELVDGAAEDLSSEEVLDRLLHLDPDFVGFSTTHSTIKDALDISMQLKDSSPGIHVCFGGHHATLSALQILQNEDCVDSVVRGDGELTIVELLQALEATALPEGVRGVYYRNSRGIIVANNDRSALPNLDALPFPARDVLRKSAEKRAPRIASICSSRGCPWSCGFCSTPAYRAAQGEAPWRARTPSDVVDELELLVEEHGYSYFLFVDDNIVLPNRQSKERLSQIASQILQRGLRIEWTAMCSAAALGEDDREMFGLLKEAGLASIFIGVEAGYGPTLDLYRKYDQSASAEQSLAAVELLSGLGIWAVCGMILFHPYATPKELMENGRFIKDLADNPSVRMIAPLCRRLEAYPGTALFDKIRRDGLLLTDKPYLDAYAYKFVSSDVQLVADIMCSLLPMVVDTDWLIWDARELLRKADVEETQLGRKRLSLEDCPMRTQATVEDINCLNLAFLEVALDLAKVGDRATLDKEAATYLNRLKAQEVLLRENYEAALALISWPDSRQASQGLEVYHD